MSELRNLLKQVTKQNTLPAEIVYVRQLTNNNTCTVQRITDTFNPNPYNDVLDNNGIVLQTGMSANDKLIAEQDFLYNIKYSVDSIKFLKKPSINSYSLLLYIDENKNSGIIILNSSISDFIAGDSNTNSFIVKTKDTSIKSEAVSKTNENANIYFYSNRVRFDLSGDRGDFDYTGDHFYVTDFNVLEFKNRCGNRFKINCNGISNIISSNTDALFTVMKTTYNEDQNGLDCNVLNPWFNNENKAYNTIAFDLYNTILNSILINKTFNFSEVTLFECEQIFSSDIYNSIIQFNKKTIPNPNIFISNLTSEVFIEYSDQFFYDSNSKTKYLHNDFKLYIDDIKTLGINSELNNKIKILLEIVLNIKNKKYLGNKDYLYLLLEYISGEGRGIEIFDTYDNLYNNLDYDTENANCNKTNSNNAESNGIYLGQDIVAKLSDNISNLAIALKDFVNLGGIAPSGGGTVVFAGQPTLLTNITNITNELSLVSENITKLLK